ncbi:MULTISPECIES: AAA family ATPase [Thauera]|jgi:SpoVK/Ycf46/Vps4 family AAA+-type ATPase|uniref:AAA ATPase central domain protein n=1 Tax=Thauera aminoaromatica TaxID=164330 RepID=C4ZMT4_THASP|nr:AAA family ATPase [Thauera aminoaromatica]ACK53128.1 AAA ATPase central domain protein [Thauera aminoaromatica]
MNARNAAAAAETARRPVDSGVPDRVERLIVHLDAEHARRDRALDAAFASIGPELRAIEQELRATLRWGALYPGLTALRRKLGLAPLELPAFLILGCALVLWILAWEMIGSMLSGLVVAVAATLGGMVALRRYRLTGVQDRLETKLMRFAGRDDSQAFPYRFELLFDYPDAAPELGEMSFSNIDEPLPGGCAILLCDTLADSIAWITRGTVGWRIQVEGSAPLVPAGMPVDARFDALVARFDALRERILERNEARQALESGCLRRDALAARWADIALPADVRETLLAGLVHFAYGDAAAPRGILLKGPPGTGKSLVAQAFGDCVEATFFKCSVAELKGRHIGESAGNVRELWARAREAAPAIVFIDECEGAFPARGSDQADTFTNEVVQTFLTEWDGIGGEHRVLVIGATNRSELLDDAIVSRFTDVVELLPPQGETRRELVLAVARVVGIASPPSDEAIALFSGMSGREVRNALRQAMRLAAPAEPAVEHFREAVAKMRGKTSTRTDENACWERLVLPEPVKREFEVMTEMVRESGALQQKGIPVPRALLLYGPPGTGKTQIARTLAKEAGVAFIARSTAELKGQYLGQAASRIAQSFESARANSPAILFIDELDALTAARGSEAGDALQAEALTQLLQEMDGVRACSGLVFVVAATNRLDVIDAAVRSRFAKQIEIGIPDEAGRAELLRVLLTGRPVAEELDVATLASRTEGYSGRDLGELVATAFQRAVSRTLDAGGAAADTVLLADDFGVAPCGVERSGLCRSVGARQPAFAATGGDE